MVTTLIAAVVSFVATNIDDILILTFLFGHGVSPWRVTAGQFLGFGWLVAISLIGYFARMAVPSSWLALLGILPIVIGIKKLIELRQDNESEEPHSTRLSTLSIAAITFSNGGDNIGIYVPLFSSLVLTQLIVTMVVFFVLLAAWCVAGYFLGNIPLVRRSILRYGHMLVPFALIALGIFIIMHLRY